MDLIGRKYGNLEVIGEAPTKGSNTYWVCRCTCGTVKEVSASNLLQGKTKSCGCLKYIRTPKGANSKAKCPYPSYGCKKSWSGLCCSMCDEPDCRDRCKNTPEKCGLLKGVWR